MADSSRRAQPLQTRDQPAEPTKNPADVGRALRLRLLTRPPAEIAGKPTKEFPRTYGILMDWPIGEQTATVVSTFTGAASLYTTSTFGVIGGEGHESVGDAAKSFVRTADQFYDAATLANEYPYPTAGRVRFYLLTFDGVRVIDTDLASMTDRTSKYVELFRLGHAVVTQLRLDEHK